MDENTSSYSTILCSAVRLVLLLRQHVWERCLIIAFAGHRWCSYRFGENEGGFGVLLWQQNSLMILEKWFPVGLVRYSEKFYSVDAWTLLKLHVQNDVPEVWLWRWGILSRVTLRKGGYSMLPPLAAGTTWAYQPSNNTTRIFLFGYTCLTLDQLFTFSKLGRISQKQSISRWLTRLFSNPLQTLP